MRMWRGNLSLNGRFRHFSRPYAATRFFGEHQRWGVLARIEKPLCRDFVSSLICHAYHNVQRTQLSLDIFGEFAELPLPGFDKCDRLLQIILRLVPGFQKGNQPLFLPPPKLIELNHRQSNARGHFAANA